MSSDVAALSSAVPWRPGVLLPHLSSQAAPVRQVIAAYALIGLNHIMEIGGAGLPITRFLQHKPLSVTVIDPKIEAYESEVLNGHACKVRHLRRKFLDEDAAHVQRGLGVVFIGLSLKPFGTAQAVSRALVHLCASAERVVIEHAITLDRALDQAPHLVAAAGLVETWGVDLTLRDACIAASGHERRRLSVMRPTAPAPG